MAELSVVIPTLNAAETLGATLAALGLGLEVIVVDGGSTDRTVEIARAAGAIVTAGRRGRGTQLAHGARCATAPWLLFVHADTRLAPEWRAAVGAFIADPGNRERAAVFRLAFDDTSALARRLERIVAWRTRRLGLPYGDQGLVIARRFYDALGGYRTLPIMEDVDFVRRIGRRRLSVLAATALTSAARYRRHGFAARLLRNMTCLALYLLGVPPVLIARLYEGRRSP